MISFLFVQSWLQICMRYLKAKLFLCSSFVIAFTKLKLYFSLYDMLTSILFMFQFHFFDQTFFLLEISGGTHTHTCRLPADSTKSRNVYRFILPASNHCHFRSICQCARNINCVHTCKPRTHTHPFNFEHLLIDYEILCFSTRSLDTRRLISIQLFSFFPRHYFKKVL